MAEIQRIKDSSDFSCYVITKNREENSTVIKETRSDKKTRLLLGKMALREYKVNTAKWFCRRQNCCGMIEDKPFCLVQ